MLELLAQGAESTQQQPSIWQSPLLFIVPLILVWWLLVIRPQRQQEKTRKAQIESMKKGDRVVTRGGILGIVSRVKDDEVIVRIDEEGKVRVPFSKAAIEQVLTKQKQAEGGG